MLSTISNTTFFRGLVLLLMVSVVSFGCKDDEVLDGIAVLHYDGDNDRAPLLTQSTFESAARFQATQMANYYNDELTQVEFYFVDLPLNCEVFIRATGANSRPSDTPLYASGNIVNSLNSRSWNTHTLSTPLVLDGTDIWVGIRYAQNAQDRTLGCDTGPADPDGEWTYDALDGEWQPLRTRTGGAININWNIRAVIELKE